jgi:hypothetical protein
MGLRGTIINGQVVISRNPGNKFRAISKVVDGQKFHSCREAERYMGLKVLLRAGEITDLRTQVPFSIEVNGQHICKYIADFTYRDLISGEFVVEDSKGMVTKEFRLKKKLMLAVLGIDVREV